MPPACWRCFSSCPRRARRISTRPTTSWISTTGPNYPIQAAELADGGYELSDGTWVSFAEWYHTDWPDIRFEMMTQFTPDFGLLWGGSTGERGEKYTIDPSISLGFVAQVRTGPSSALSMTFRTIFAGELTEKTCEADYGDIGGVQVVNCRLAASILAPEDTLEYLVNADPNRLHIALTYSGTF